MKTINSFTVVNLRRLPHHRNVLAHIETSMDVPLNGTSDPETVLQYFVNKSLSLLIKQGPHLVGLIGLHKGVDVAPNHWLTTTLLFPAYRGSGVNLDVKRELVKHAQLLNIPIGAVVRDWNARSSAAVVKAFPDVVAVPFPPRVGDPTGDSRLFYDLSAVNTQPATTHSFPNLEAQLKKWWSNQKPTPIVEETLLA